MFCLLCSTRLFVFPCRCLSRCLSALTCGRARQRGASSHASTASSRRPSPSSTPSARRPSRCSGPWTLDRQTHSTSRCTLCCSFCGVHSVALVVESALCAVGCGVCTLCCWLWRVHSVLLVVESALYAVGCGKCTVCCWLCRAHCVLLVLESALCAVGC